LKQLLEFQGETFVERAAKAPLLAGAKPVIVVVGANANEIREKLEGIDVDIIFNEAWPSGLASSILAGIQRARQSTVDAVLITLADQPLVDGAALTRLIDAFDCHPIVASSYAGTIGVPAIFASKYFDDLENLTGDRGAGKWLREHSDLVTSIPLPEAETDIDTQEDMNAIRNR
jgi:CTP:molybdopterin cytidylyltransferase MocA